VEIQAKSFCLTENARRASLIALIFAPLLVLVSGALRNQQADNLLPAFFSTDSLSWFYWDQSRYGSIHSFLAFPIQNIRMNLLFQLYLRAASLVFLVVWIVESCIRNDSVNGAKHVQRFLALAFVATFLLTFQEAGDALIYGANAHPIAIPFAILALSFNYGKTKSRFTVLKTSLMVIWAAFFWGIAIWTSIFTALWAPALALLQLAYISKSENVFQRRYAIWFALHVVVVGMWSWIFAQIAKSGGEETSFIVEKFVSEALKRSYVSIPLAVYLLSAIIATVFVNFICRNWTNVFALLSSVCFVGSVPVIAASTHVQAYSYMPRYFGVQYVSALLILVVVLSDHIRTGRIERLFDLYRPQRRQLIISAMVVAIITIWATSMSKIEFGTGKVDASGFVNTGYGISSDLESELLAKSGNDVQFVAGSYWYVWPAVFDLRSRGSEVVAITKKATHQKQFPMLYSAAPVLGICLGEPDACWRATINAQLNESQLFSEIDSVIIGNLADGTPVRNMWVSKYPIRFLER
jgi:hypothetical protein